MTIGLYPGIHMYKLRSGDSGGFAASSELED